MSAPKKIYLQWHGDADPADYPDGPDPDQSDVTWCADRIFEHDIEYVRVDELDRLREYARHDPSCKSWGRIPCPCDCGYDALMADLGETK